MATKVTVDKNYQPVAEGSSEGAYIFNEDDPRLKDYQKKSKAANPSAGRPAKADDDGSVEHVERPKAK